MTDPRFIAGVAAGLKAAAGVAEASKRNARLCPYGNDRPGDPTWNHTEEDLCPVCNANANDSLHVCAETVRGQIIAAIRAIDPATIEEDGNHE